MEPRGFVSIMPSWRSQTSFTLTSNVTTALRKISSELNAAANIIVITITIIIINSNTRPIISIISIIILNLSVIEFVTKNHVFRLKITIGPQIYWETIIGGTLSHWMYFFFCSFVLIRRINLFFFGRHF